MLLFFTLDLKNDDSKIKMMEEFHIFSKFILKNYLNSEFTESDTKDNLNKAVICGVFYSHKSNNKYNFPACDFMIFYPALKTNLFYSEMNSEECFSNTLKWNENFFKKIRLSFIENISKNSYFGIYYERDQEKNNKNKQQEIQTINKENEMEDDLFKDFDFGYENISENKKKFLELHININNQDVIAFRLNLREVFDENPLNTMMKRVIEYEKKETFNYLSKMKIYSENEIEIENLKNSLEKKEKLLEKRKREYLYKFYVINSEKNKKIKLLKDINNSSDINNFKDIHNE